MLILSPGQSSVERAFSENKDIVDNNMVKDCLVAYHSAHDGIKHLDCPLEEAVTMQGCWILVGMPASGAQCILTRRMHSKQVQKITGKGNYKINSDIL